MKKELQHFDILRFQHLLFMGGCQRWTTNRKKASRSIPIPLSLQNYKTSERRAIPSLSPSSS
jgi:hypothetical protein